MKKLFGFGAKTEKRTATVLPTNLAALFGATEGQEMFVDASEEGVKAIDDAEANLIEANEKFAAAQADSEKLKEAQAENKSLTEEKAQLEADNKKLSEQNAELEDEPATNHTTVDKSEDTAPSAGAKKYGFELEEENTQKKAEETNEKFNL